jgi:hypothetical protein
MKVGSIVSTPDQKYPTCVFLIAFERWDYKQGMKVEAIHFTYKTQYI